MDSRLFIRIYINNDGNLEVVDQSPYERWIIDDQFDSDHQVLERIILDNGDDDPTIVSFSNIHGTSPEELRNSTTYEVPGNGLYHYQKLVIPTYEHHTEHQNENLYYRDGVVYYVDSDSGEVSSWSNLSADFDEIYDLVIERSASNCFYFDEDSFSIYDLVLCYVSVEKERIQRYVRNNCKGNCRESSDLDPRADILLAAITVIKHLMEQKEFFEAQRILNGLETCGNLCAEVRDKLKGCGCGTT